MENSNVNDNNTGLNIIQPALVSLVSEDEKAVDSELACEDKEIELAVFNPINPVISEEDLGVELEEDTNELEEANKKGFFSPVIGMAQLVGILGGRYFAQICIDENGNRRIEIRQEYETGGYSPKIIIRQSDFLRAVNFRDQNTNKKAKKAVEDFLFRLSNECLDKFDGSMVLDVKEILKALKMCYRELPVYQDFGTEQTPKEFYEGFMRVMKEMQCWDDEIALCGHKAYYPIRNDDMEYIASQLEMTKNEFVRKLAKYNFLYLTPSSRGYQTNVRITVNGDTYTEHRYCILRVNYLASK